MHDTTFSWWRFFRGAVLPSLWILAIPSVGLVFSEHVRSSWDAELSGALVDQLRSASDVPASDRAALVVEAEATRASDVCASDDPSDADLREAIGPRCDDYWEIGAIHLASVVSIGLALLTGALLAGLVAVAFANRAALYAALFTGWVVLQATSAAQVVLQGAVAFGLSYWMSVFWTNRYSPKLIFAVGVVVLAGVAALLAALFKRRELSFTVDGEPLSPEDVPAFWDRVRAIAAACGTAPPDRIVGGIDDNFFVTESPIEIGGVRHEGRTLFVSLSMLRTLTRGEADAVIAHEMAHFSGDDTAWTNRFAPLRARYQTSLSALADGGITLPIAWPMATFRALLDLAAARQSREREFRADAVAAGVTSPEEIARALIKTGVWSRFRARVESELFEREELLTDVAILQRMRSQFASYASSSEIFAGGAIPHPFDSHPSTDERIDRVGALVDAPAVARALLAGGGSWIDGCDRADEIERRMWTAFEKAFVADHEAHLAMCYLPVGDAEREVVRRHFPDMVLEMTDGEPMTIDFRGVTWPGWPTPIQFDHLADVTVVDRWSGRTLEFEPVPGADWQGTRAVKISAFRDPEASVVGLIGSYWQRRRHALAWAAR